MKVYISVDMEGISNVVMTYQLFPENEEISRCEIREIATKEVNAAIEGAFQGGASEILVNENHSGKEIIPELLDKRAILLTGKPKYLMTAEGIKGYDSLFLIGIHSMMGTADGVMDHTWTPKAFSEFRVNGKPMGEIGLNALIAGYYNIPVSLVTGDTAACDEAIDLLGNLETVAVKIGTGRFAAYCPHPEINRKKIKSAAQRAINNNSLYKPFKVKNPIKMEIDFFTQQQAMLVELIPGAKRLSSRTVAFTVDNFFEGIKIFILCGNACLRGTDSFY